MISKQSAEIDVLKMKTTIQQIIAHPVTFEFIDANAHSLDWLGPFNLNEYQNDPTCSAKMLMFLNILGKCSKSQNKLVVFSENLSSLRAIVHFLTIFHNKGQNLCIQNSWIHGQDYFFVDDETDSQLRNYYCNQFNDANNNIGR